MTAITRYLQHRRDTSANWTASATPPKAGQLCFTTDVFYTGTDQMKFKVGDGVQTWSQLDYMPIGGGSQTLQQVLTSGSVLTQNNTISGAYDLDFDVTNYTAKSSTRSRLIADDGVNQHYFDADITSGHAHIHSTVEIHGMTPKYLLETLSTNHSFNMEDGVGARISVNGGNSDLYFNELTNEIYAYSSTKISLDAPNVKLVNETASKMVYLDANKYFKSATFGISDVELNSNKGIAGGYASLDGAGKVPSNQMPAIAITDTYVVASQAAMLALSTAETGDVAVRTDVNKSFILKGTTYSVLADWQELLTPTSTVLSVNGYIGAVSLVTSDVVTAGSVTNAMLAGSIAFSKLIGTDITAVGSITTGTWGTGAVIAGATMTLGSDAAYDIYYRGATGVLTRLANGATGKFLSSTSGAAPTWESPLSICPVYSGKQRFIPYNTITTSSSFAGAVYYTPYYTGNKHTVTTITIEVTTLAAASTVKLALYADNNGVPGALIESSGDISAATTGDKSYTFSSPRLLSNPVYWLAVQLSSSTIGVRVSASFPTLIYQGGNGTGGTYKETQAYGAFPVNATPVVVSATALAITLTPQ